MTDTPTDDMLTVTYEVDKTEGPKPGDPLLLVNLPLADGTDDIYQSRVPKAGKHASIVAMKTKADTLTYVMSGVKAYFSEEDFDAIAERMDDDDDPLDLQPLVGIIDAIAQKVASLGGGGPKSGPKRPRRGPASKGK